MAAIIDNPDGGLLKRISEAKCVTPGCHGLLEGTNDERWEVGRVYEYLYCPECKSHYTATYVIQGYTRESGEKE